MYFKSFFDEQLAQMAYLVGCQQTGEAIIIDPLRDLEPHQDCRVRRFNDHKSSRDTYPC